MAEIAILFGFVVLFLALFEAFASVWQQRLARGFACLAVATVVACVLSWGLMP